jgi:hypothetical protein
VRASRGGRHRTATRIEVEELVMRTRWTVGLAAVPLALLATVGGTAVSANAAVPGTPGDPGKQQPRSYATQVNGYEIVTLPPAAVANLTPRTGSCPPGKRALGGGAQVQGAGSLAASFPTPDGTGWTAIATSTGGTVSFGVHVICANAR